MITRSRTRVKAAPPAALRQRTLTQASQSVQAVAKLWDQMASTSIPSSADADADKQDNRKSMNNMNAADAGVGDKESSSSSRPWLTPKGKRFRIPELESCPPAPKKMRTTSPTRKLKRSAPIAFFYPPELESSFYSSESSLLKTAAQ